MRLNYSGLTSAQKTVYKTKVFKIRKNLKEIDKKLENLGDNEKVKILIKEYEAQINILYDLKYEILNTSLLNLELKNLKL